MGSHASMGDWEGQCRLEVLLGGRESGTDLQEGLVAFPASSPIDFLVGSYWGRWQMALPGLQFPFNIAVVSRAPGTQGVVNIMRSWNSQNFEDRCTSIFPALHNFERSLDELMSTDVN